MREEIKVKVEIDKEEVWEEVKKIAVYTGANRMRGVRVNEAGEAVDEGVLGYEGMMLVDEAHFDLRRWFKELLRTLTGLLHEYVDDVKFTDKGGTVQLQMQMPGNYQGEMTPVVNEGVYWYLVNGLVGKWFGIVNREEEEKYMAMATEKAREILVALSQRRRPERDI